MNRVAPRSRVVFDRFSVEAEAAHAHLAAQLIREGTPLQITVYRYLDSRRLGEPGTHVSPGVQSYTHRFVSTDGEIRSVTTTHTPGQDDLGGLIQLDP